MATPRRVTRAAGPEPAPEARPASGMAGDSPGRSGEAASSARRLRRAFGRAKKIEGLAERLVAHAAGLAGDELDPAEATAYMARRVLMSQIAEAASVLSPDKMDQMAPGELARFIMHLESSRLAGDRLRIRHEKLYARARRDVLEELEKALQARPALLAALRRVFPADPAAEENEKTPHSSCPRPPAVISE